MSVYIPKGSPTGEYLYDFWRGGKRFSDTTGCTNRRAAEKVEAEAKVKAVEGLKQAAAVRVSLKLKDVAARYWDAVAKGTAGADNTERDLNRLLDYFKEHHKAAGGDGIAITAIALQDIEELIARRRADTVAHTDRLITPATVNRSTTEVLRKLYTYCKRHGVRFDQEPHWAGLLLPEPDEHPRELRPGEGEKITAAVRDDYAPLIAMALATGLRQREIYDLRWKEVDWLGGQIKRMGKGKKPVARPITDRVRDILMPLRGHHGEFVFTYVADRTRSYWVGKKGERRQEMRVAGKRYPIGKENLKTRWRRDRPADMADFRFHDFRHDLATKALRQTGNLKLVAQMLNHRDLRTTSRYAHVLDTEVAAAFAQVQGALHGKAGCSEPGALDKKSHEKSQAKVPELKLVLQRKASRD
jgi:integrase